MNFPFDFAVFKRTKIYLLDFFDIFRRPIVICFPKNIAYFKHDDIFLIPPQIACLPSNSIVTVRYA
jgi:hypothetical protein